MKESFWGVMILLLGVTSIVFIYFFQNITNTDQQNYTLLKETTEAAMFDAIDQQEYAQNGNIKINGEKFVDAFVRRYAQNASLSNTYQIDIYDISEYPPKVTLRVRSKKDQVIDSQNVEFTIDNKISGILESSVQEVKN